MRKDGIDDGAPGAAAPQPPAVRPVGPADLAAVGAILEAAFETPAEARLVEELRRDGSMICELAAYDDTGVTGCIALSRMQEPSGTAGLGPLAVRPDRRGQGFGGALIRAALDFAGGSQCRAVFVLGEPRFYGRFGFTAAAAFRSPYPPAYMLVREAMPGGLAGLSGRLRYAPAFEALG
jgi:putative acetyltransferase